MTDLPTNSPEHTGASQPFIVSKTHLRNQERNDNDRTIGGGLTVLEYLQGVREQTGIIFGNFTRISKTQGGAYRVSVGYGRADMERNLGVGVPWERADE